MAMSSSSKIIVDGLRFGFDLVSKLVESFVGRFATDWIEVCFLKEGVVVVDIYFHGG